MVGEIARFLLNVLFTLFGTALLLRVWMQAARMPRHNPISNVIFQVTNWLVLPLQYALRPRRGIDWASIVAALLASLVYVMLRAAMEGRDPFTITPLLIVVALLVVVKWALNLIIWLTILLALLSWLNPFSPAMPVLHQLTAPFLNPLRRILPRTSGIDLSPLIVFVIGQILLMIVARAVMSFGLFGM